jgi:secreted trypsin-like serine protease
VVIPRGSEGLTVQYGIVSQGYEEECGKLGYPGIYTSVKHFLSWIIDTMAKYD